MIASQSTYKSIKHQMGFLPHWFIPLLLPLHLVRTSNSNNPILSNNTILKLKQDITVDKLCNDLPHKIATCLQYSHSFTYTAEPDYDYLQSLLHYYTPNIREI